MKTATASELVIPTYSLAEGSPAGEPLLDVLVADGRAFPRRKANFLVPHRKGYYELLLVRHCHSRHWLDMQRLDLQPNTLYFTTPAHVHLKEQTEPLTGTVVSFAPELLVADASGTLAQLPLLTNPAQAHALQLTPADVDFLETLFVHLRRECAQHQPWRTVMLLTYLQTALLYLSRLYQAQYPAPYPPEGPLLARFTALLNAHYTSLHQVSDYAARLGLRPGVLNAQLRQQTGKTASTLLHERLVLEARRRLFHTDLSVAEIAFALGFEDPSYFSRFFRRLTGQAPAAYRAATREMYP
ncbi:MAG: helix-turn-helix domain-containing protein [Janthinobacterium lividum]